MNTHEIVTLQIGHYSNFIGTHWWNIQESNFVYKSNEKDTSEIDHDVLFREGINQHKQITYTPRLISIDLKGSLNCLKLDDDLYSTNQNKAQILWNGPITEIRHDVLKKNEFQKDLDELYKEEANEDYSLEDDLLTLQSGGEPCTSTSRTVEKVERLKGKTYNLDDTVNVWSDFRRFGLHPKSLAIVNEYLHENETDPFNQYHQGTELYKNYEIRCDYEDRLHKFIEECDYLQGIQVLSDCHNGFAGLTASILDDISDEYGNKSLLIMPCAPIRSQLMTSKAEAERSLNTAFSLANFYGQSNVAVLPLAMDGLVKGKVPKFPNVDYNRDLDYHTSALLAMCLDTMTLPLRTTKNSCLTMTTSYQPLTVYDRKILSLQACLPFPMTYGESLFDALDTHSTALPWQPVSNHALQNGDDVKALSQSVVLRGLECKEDRSSKESLLNEYISQFCDKTYNMTFYNDSPCKLRSPMPQHIFTGIDSKGYTSSSPALATSIPLLSCVQQNNTPGDWLNVLAKVTSKLRPHHIEVDTLTELNDNLLCHSDLYLE